MTTLLWADHCTDSQKFKQHGSTPANKEWTNQKMFLPLCLYAWRETWESPIWWAEKQDARFFVLRSIIIPQRGIHHSDKWWQKVHYEKRQEVSDADELLVLCLCSTLYSFIRWLVQGQMQKHFLHIEGEVILKGLRGKFRKCYTGFKFPCDSSGIGAAWWTKTEKAQKKAKWLCR